MPAITQHHSADYTKMLLIGDSGTGKTGALASLAACGYNLRILDFDNGLSVLTNYLVDPTSPYVKLAPQAPERVFFETCTDKMKTVNGRIYAAKAEAWPKAVKLLDLWKTPDSDFGKLETWGPNDILVIDSLSKMSDAALNFHLMSNSALGTARTQNEARRDIGAAQTMLKDALQLLYDSHIKTNVIVISHITMVTESGGAPGQDPSKPGEFAASATGYPSAIGRALSPQIPRWFDTVLLARTSGLGQSVRRQIFTRPQNISGQVIAAKNAAPLRVKDSYPLSTGLAEYMFDNQGKEHPKILVELKAALGGK